MSAEPSYRIELALKDTSEPVTRSSKFEAAAIMASTLQGLLTLRVRSPRPWVQELYLLGHQQGAELRGEALDKILVRVHGCPMCATLGVIIEFPEMYKLMCRSGISGQILVLPAFLERREADLLPSAPLTISRRCRTEPYSAGASRPRPRPESC
jgi:hypothetical protein